MGLVGAGQCDCSQNRGRTLRRHLGRSAGSLSRQAPAQPSPFSPSQVSESGPANHTSVSLVDALVKSSPATMAAAQPATAGSWKPAEYQYRLERVVPINASESQVRPRSGPPR